MSTHISCVPPWSLLVSSGIAGWITNCAFSVIIKDVENVSLPTHVQVFGEIDPFVFPCIRFAEKTTVFSAESETGDIAEMFLEKYLVASTDDPHCIFGIFRQRPQRTKKFLCRHSSTRFLDNRSQCPVIIKQQQPFLCAVKLSLQLIPVELWCCL